MDLSLLSRADANITTIRFINPSRVDVVNTVYEYRTRSRFSKPKDTNGMTVNIEFIGNLKKIFGVMSICSFSIKMQSEAALIQDAVSVFAKAFDEDSDFIENFQTSDKSCDKYKYSSYNSSTSGKDLLNRIDGVSGTNTATRDLIFVFIKFK